MRQGCSAEEAQRGRNAPFLSRFSSGISYSRFEHAFSTPHFELAHVTAAKSLIIAPMSIYGNNHYSLDSTVNAVKFLVSRSLFAACHHPDQVNMGRGYRCVIADESHYLKNPSTKRSIGPYYHIWTYNPRFYSI